MRADLSAVYIFSHTEAEVEALSGLADWSVSADCSEILRLSKFTIP